MLAVQRLVVAELVGDEPGDEAHIGAAAVDHPGGCGWAVDRLRVAPIDEYEQLARQRIAAERLARKRVQAVEGFAHVDRAAIDMDADGAFGEEHQPRDR